MHDEHLTDDDAERIELGFRVLARRCRTWPAPRDLFDAMPPPPRVYFRALAAPEMTPADKAAWNEARLNCMASVREIFARHKPVQTKNDERDNPP